MHPVFGNTGYLDVGAGKHLHYMLSESEKAPNKDPLVFWFNGGKVAAVALAVHRLA